ncbi:trehalose-phosphatase [Streptomyces sp. RKND-216]|uniref:trehalose-phosphatase n=1 Tax=Streptomyces sp. RKND-216 TaxID=2562581 RepID=UPI00109DAA0F|nr:trehalose-phosphatase [Streptomyces sp. RKND-216]THA25810.1 trehalose-phosphatase [Streptomyces sp. RKND-216]
MGSDLDSLPPSFTRRCPAPLAPAGRRGLEKLFEQPGRALLALDFDGVLAPIVPDPEQARAHPDAVPALARLAPHLATVAVVTGRPAATAVEYGGLAGVPDLDRLVVLGAYGAERWDAVTGAVEAPPPHPGVEAVREELPGALADVPGTDGVHVEDKGNALAVHTRRAAEPAVAFARLREPMAALAARHGLAVEPGRMVLELRPPGMDKGRALTDLARETGATSVVYAGDDLGDLAAFAAVDALRSEGVGGLLVCSGSDEVRELADRADLVVDGPDGVVALLEALAAALGPDGNAGG